MQIVSLKMDVGCLTYSAIGVCGSVIYIDSSFKKLYLLIQKTRISNIFFQICYPVNNS